MTTLGALLEAAGLADQLPAAAQPLEVSTVELDSRRCTTGSVFVAMPGTVTSGDAYVADAVARGAVCVVGGARIEAPLAVRVAPESLRGVLATLSSAVVGDPKDELALAAVTGTNGKTTVTWLLDGILTTAGYSSMTIGTLTGARTTPAAPDLHRALRKAADVAHDRGRPGAVALEVSSHALDQGRVDGVRFDVAIFTNLSHEHLDYHGTMERYFEAKARLFLPAATRSAVICVDGPWGGRLAAQTTVPVREVASAEALVREAVVGRTVLEWRGLRISTSLTGRLNVPNTLLAVAAAEQLGIGAQVAASALASVPSVPGRLETVGDGSPAVIVDYAHTPDALEAVLRDLRSLRSAGRLVCVFGCGGDRDAEKRPQMGSVAARLADEVVVTSDNPRSEDPEAIIDEVLAGARGPAPVRREADRASAIARAIEGASADDLVLIAGKGHETTQEFADRTIPFDDREVARTALAARGASC